MADPVPGSVIPGSVYVRAYCCNCGEPIRIFPHDETARYGKDYSFEMCHGGCNREIYAPPRGTGLCYRQRLKMK